MRSSSRGKWRPSEDSQRVTVLRSGGSSSGNAAARREMLPPKRSPMRARMRSLSSLSADTENTVASRDGALQLGTEAAVLLRTGRDRRKHDRLLARVRFRRAPLEETERAVAVSLRGG